MLWVKNIILLFDILWLLRYNTCNDGVINVMETMLLQIDDQKHRLNSSRVKHPNCLNYYWNGFFALHNVNTRQCQTFIDRIVYLTYNLSFTIIVSEWEREMEKWKSAYIKLFHIQTNGTINVRLRRIFMEDKQLFSWVCITREFN